MDQAGGVQMSVVGTPARGLLITCAPCLPKPLPSQLRHPGRWSSPLARSRTTESRWGCGQGLADPVWTLPAAGTGTHAGIQGPAPFKSLEAGVQAGLEMGVARVGDQDGESSAGGGWGLSWARPHLTGKTSWAAARGGGGGAHPTLEVRRLPGADAVTRGGGRGGGNSY